MGATAVRQERRTVRGLAWTGLVAAVIAFAPPASARDARASADLDDLPDEWEQQIVDANAADALEDVWDVLPEDDFDSDGGSNAEELFWGTDPTVAESKLALDWADAVARLRVIGQALLEYQADHGADVLPPRLMTLASEGYLDAAMLVTRADPFHGAQGGMPDNYNWNLHGFEDVQETGSSFLYEFSEAGCYWIGPDYHGPYPPTWYDVKMWQLAGGLDGGPYDRRVFPVVRCYWLAYPDYMERHAYHSCVYDRRHVPLTVVNLAVDCRSVLATESYWEDTVGHLTPDDQPVLRTAGIPSAEGDLRAVVRVGECIAFPLWPKVLDVAGLQFRLVPDDEGHVYGGLSRNAFAWTPDVDAPASVTVTVEMYRDDAGTEVVLAASSYTISVVRNQGPSFVKGADQMVAENTGPQTVAGWATAIDDGDAEVAQELSFTVTTDGAALFAVLPALNAATGDLTYTPALDANGSATVTVTLTDDGTAGGPALTSAPQVFAIEVTPVNDPPSVTGASATTTVEGGISTLDANLADTDNTTLEVTVGWGDGSPPETFAAVSVGRFTRTHAYADDGADDRYLITVTARDPELLSDAATTWVTVTNLAPADLALTPASGTQSAPYMGMLSATEVAGDPLVWSKTGGAAWIAVSPDGRVSGTPGNADTGNQILEVTVEDGDGGVSTATFTITVSLAAGHALWDLTGHYATTLGTTLGGAPLTLDVLHDTKGRLTGTGTLDVPAGAGVVRVTMPIRGSAGGHGGALVVSMRLKGVSAAEAVSASLVFDLTLDAAARQLSGQANGSIRVGAVTAPVSESVALALAAPMDGTWALQLDVARGTRRTTGTALLRLSNGVEHPLTVAGKPVGGLAELTLVGHPSDPLAKGIRIRALVTRLADGWARLERVSLQGYGQTVGW
jgi:hypothetical protein